MLQNFINGLAQGIGFFGSIFLFIISFRAIKRIADKEPKELIEPFKEYLKETSGKVTITYGHFNPPSVSEMMNTQYGSLLSHYWDKLKLIKNGNSSIK